MWCYLCTSTRATLVGVSCAQGLKQNTLIVGETVASSSRTPSLSTSKSPRNLSIGALVVCRPSIALSKKLTYISVGQGALALYLPYVNPEISNRSFNHVDSRAQLVKLLDGMRWEKTKSSHNLASKWRSFLGIFPPKVAHIGCPIAIMPATDLVRGSW
ncbi:hypothetical protein HAX54_047096 [Datura stramonium]|uniref:Uncharacterized protein n=1 Tax=Datura stramonium TaxID=4076 RepID=A0ABS8SSQ3_DATST|nr:hypothetical protein [Datura stramonium]